MNFNDIQQMNENDKLASLIKQLISIMTENNIEILVVDNMELQIKNNNCLITFFEKKTDEIMREHSGYSENPIKVPFTLKRKSSWW